MLIIGTFAAVYPSFIVGVQAQTGYENGYGYDNNNNSYNSVEYPQPSEYESNGYPPENTYPDIVVPIDFPTIQEAIDAANEGDVIKVLSGTYTEQIAISKSLTIIGSDAKSTIIEAPPLEELDTNIIGLPYIVEVNNGAEVTMKGFTIKGPQGTNCDELIGVSVIENATINLTHSIIKGCTQNGVAIGFEGTGHATITKTFITDYREHGVFAFGTGTTLTMSYNKVVGSAPDALAIIGILFVAGATATITHNEVSENICNIPDICGQDWFTQFQAFGIAGDAVEGTIISNNYVSNNDAGIGMGLGTSGCCIFENNKLKDNRFFGFIVVDGEFTVSNTKIFGGNVGVAAIAYTANTVATLDRVKIVDAEIPIQALSTGTLTAAVNVLSPSFFAP